MNDDTYGAIYRFAWNGDRGLRLAPRDGLLLWICGTTWLDKISAARTVDYSDEGRVVIALKSERVTPSETANSFGCATSCADASGGIASARAPIPPMAIRRT